MNAAHNIEAPTHRATLGGETVLINATTFRAELDALVRRHPGAGTPQVEPLSAPVASVAPAAPNTNSSLCSEEISESGRARALADEAIARANGFRPRDPVYSIGTTVIDLGVENARRSQMEHAAKPLAVEVARELATTIRNEKRQDLAPTALRSMKLSPNGAIVVGVEQDAAGEWFGGKYLSIEEDAFKRLIGRAIPAQGAAAYFADCPPELRAKNFNFWSNADSGEQQHVLRTRLDRSGNRGVFAAVSERYTAFDGDKIGEALAGAFPRDARGSLDYDGQRYRVEGLWHTDVAADQFVAGEIFKAGVIVRGADDGSGSIRVQSVIWRNLCRNLIILDRAIGVDVRIRHTGSVAALTRSFRTSFETALRSVEPFARAWGSAMLERDELLIQRSAGTTSSDITGLPASKVLAGLLNGIVERELVRVPGRSKEIVPKLLDAHFADEAQAQYGISRASIVNAFTRYAHEREVDPWVADQIREDAGRLLTNTRRDREPEPIPYIAFESF